MYYVLNKRRGGTAAIQTAAPDIEPNSDSTALLEQPTVLNGQEGESGEAGPERNKL